jgi:hypothetical protein
VKEQFIDLYNDIISYARENFADELDEAYDYFWEEEDPTDYYMGTVLDLSFVNFEDWMVCDYRPREGKGFIDRYIEANSPDDEKKALLESMRDSIVSIYEVTSLDGDTLTLRDLAREKDIRVPSGALGNLNVGEVFAARIIDHKGESSLGRGVWPFGTQRKDQAMEFLNAHVERVRKNRSEEEDMDSLLKQDSYIFNNIWLSCLSLK